MKTSDKRLTNQALWQERIQAQASSGKSVAHYCHDAGKNCLQLTHCGQRYIKRWQSETTPLSERLHLFFGKSALFHIRYLL